LLVYNFYIKQLGVFLAIQNQIMESLSPNIFVNDMKATIAFYKVLGFGVTMSVPEEGDDLVWAMMINGNVTLMFQTFASLENDLPEISRIDGGSLLLYINLKNIRQFFDDIKDKVTVLKGLETTFYGATEFSVKDNNGYVITFAQHE
jgi:uncharacterized glyoxalase superfamily protein PhnB